MGFGGAKKAQALQQQQLQFQLLAQNQQRSQLEAQQQAAQQAAAIADAKRQEEARLQREQEQASLQKKQQLSIFDAIKTGPQGLLNTPASVGRFTLLGN